MRKGFTLIELIIVVIVIGILATVAIPQYLKATERAKGAKAKSNLGLIASAEKMYRATNDVYVAAADKAAIVTALANDVELGGLNGDSDWSYKVESTDTSTNFTVTATKIGANSGETITLNQAGAWVDGFTP